MDGSSPNFASKIYTQEFTITETSLIRAVAVSTNFAIAEAEPVRVDIKAAYKLVVSTPGGGRVHRSPEKSAYRENEVVIITAEPDPGWQFLGWVGNEDGTNPVLNVTMNETKEMRAFFGAPVTLNVIGNGTIQAIPARSLYPYGTRISLTPLPAEGHFFALWGGDGSGTEVPLETTVTNANLSVAALFMTLANRQVSLSVILDGNGSVNVSPHRDVYMEGETVELTATARDGYRFLGWSGALNTTNSSATLTLERSKTVIANFSSDEVSLTNAKRRADGLFEFFVQGPTNEVFLIQRSLDLNNWSTITNVVGGTLFRVDGGDAARSFYRSAALQ